MNFKTAMILFIILSSCASNKRVVDTNDKVYENGTFNR